MKKLTTLICTLVLPFLLQAQTWNGSSSSDWFTAANWTPSGVPANNASVTIPASLSTYPTLTGNVVVGGLTMSSGSSINLATYSLVDSGNISLSNATVSGGGNFQVINAPGSVVINNCTITSTVKVINYRSTCNFLDNTIIGNVTIADSSTHNTSNNYIDGNYITGNLKLVHAANGYSGYNMYEGYGSSGSLGNYVSGDMEVLLSGIGGFYSSYSHRLNVNGNLTITRTAPGVTELYKTVDSATFVGGHFSFTTSGGTTNINLPGTNMVTIGQTINITAPALGAAFTMQNMKNGTAGGTVSVSGATTVNIRLDTLKANVTIQRYTGVSTIFDNSITGNLSISDSSSNNTNTNYIDGNWISGDLNLTHAPNYAGYSMTEGYGSPSGNGNKVGANALFRLIGKANFYSSYTHPLSIGGNFTIIRDSVGYTNLYGTTSSNSTVGGNFSLSSAGGAIALNTPSGAMVNISGTFDIDVPNMNAGTFEMYKMKNNASGGTVTVVGAYNVNVRNDSLKSNMTILNYTQDAKIWDNSITGNLSVSDSSSNNSGSNYIDGNWISGDLNLTHTPNYAGYSMVEGGGSPSGNGNKVGGNALFRLIGKANFYSSYTHPLSIGGNFTIIRDSVGYTNLYGTTSSNSTVGGNFSFSSVGGPIVMNTQTGAMVNIGGTFDINVPNMNSSNFEMYKMKNNTLGGTVTVVGTYDVNIRNDSLKSNMSILNYTHSANILDNSITGNLSASDSSSNNSNSNYIDGNWISGDFNLTHAPNYAGYNMVEGNGSPSGNGNKVGGNALFRIIGKANFYSSYTHPLSIGGNFTIIRDSVGYTNLFGTTSSNSIVGGNFSLSSVGGQIAINTQTGAMVNIGGTFDIDIPNMNAGTFEMYKMKNNTSGGTIAVAGAYNVNIRNDSLKSNMSILNFTHDANIWDNSITGNLSVSDSSSNNSGSKYIDGNLIGGDFNLTHTPNYSGYLITEGEGSPSNNGNRVIGNANFNAIGASTFISSNTNPLIVGGNFTFNRTVPGVTNLYVASHNTTQIASVGGNFSLNTVGGGTWTNGGADSLIKVLGTFNVNAPNELGTFSMHKMRNYTPGGTVNIGNATYFTMASDTLVADVWIDSFTNNFSLFKNKITGATYLSDNPTASGNQYLDDNYFNGNLTLVHNSVNSQMYEGYGGPIAIGNRVAGLDSIVNSPGAKPLNLSYNHIHQADSDFVINPGAAISIPNIYFGGTTHGHLKQNLSIPLVTIKKENNRRLILDSSLTITNKLSFEKGLIESSPSRKLIFASGTSHVGADDTSHVIGYVMKVGTTAFTFPLGDTDHYSPIGISSSVRATDTFAAQYIAIAPDTAGYDSSLHVPSIHHISSREYWLLDRNSYSSIGVYVTLGFVRNNSGKIDNLSDLTVAHWYGSPAKWQDEGNGGTTGVYNLGTITSLNQVSDFSPFTLASTTANNPLPIDILSFEAKRQGQRAQLTWTVEQEAGLDYYEVERSADGKSFLPLASVQVDESLNRNGYSVDDYSPIKGNNFYRLALVDNTGKRKYSATRMLVFGNSTAADYVQIFPNPTHSLLQINAGLDWAGAQISVQDVMGHVLIETVIPETGSLPLSLEQLPTGVYHLELNNSKQHYQTSVIKN